MPTISIRFSRIHHECGVVTAHVGSVLVYRHEASDRLAALEAAKSAAFTYLWVNFPNVLA